MKKCSNIFAKSLAVNPLFKKQIVPSKRGKKQYKRNEQNKIMFIERTNYA